MLVKGLAFRSTSVSSYITIKVISQISPLPPPVTRHVPVISWQNRPAPIATVEAPEAGVKINIKRGVPLQKDGSA